LIASDRSRISVSQDRFHIAAQLRRLDAVSLSTIRYFPSAGLFSILYLTDGVYCLPPRPERTYLDDLVTVGIPGPAERSARLQKLCATRSGQSRRRVCCYGARGQTCSRAFCDCAAVPSDRIPGSRADAVADPVRVAHRLRESLHASRANGKRRVHLDVWRRTIRRIRRGGSRPFLTA